MEVSVPNALAWRLDRHHLITGAESATDVVSRLGAVPAWSGNPKLAIGRRLARPLSNAVAVALDNGDLIRTYAFRGATHLLAARDAGIYMAIRGANRQWELPSWRDHYDLGPHDWPPLREVVRDAVASGPISQAELVDAVTRETRFRHLRTGLSHPSHTLLKPFAWQGDLCFGPSRDGQPTYQSPNSSPHWTGLPELDQAGRQAVLNYLAGYGPATRDNLHYWLVAGLSAGRRRLDGWIADLIEDDIVEIQVDGGPMFHLCEHLASLAAAEPASEEMTLLPAYDQWVLGPGTADERIVPAGCRSAVTRGSNLVLRAGKVTGTWKIDGDVVAISWFARAGGPSQAKLELEVERLSSLLQRDLKMTITVS